MRPNFWKEVVISSDNQENFLERIQACVDALGGNCPACGEHLTTSNTDVDNWFSRISHWGCKQHGGGKSQATQVADFLVRKGDGSYVRGLGDEPFPALQGMVDRLKAG